MLHSGMTGYIDPWNYETSVVPFPESTTTAPLHYCTILEVRGAMLLVQLEDGRIGEIKADRFTAMYMRNDKWAGRE